MARNRLPRPRPHLARSARRGVTLVVAMFSVFLLLGITGALLTTSLGSHRERHSAVERQRAMLTAQAGIAEAMAQLSMGGETDLGSKTRPVERSQGAFVVDLEPVDDDTFVLTSLARSGSEFEALEAVVQRVSGGIFHNAIFAGNSSGDPLYSLPLGGRGLAADDIQGDLYSGGNVARTGDATVGGTVRASGTITGLPGEENAKQYPPDLSRMDYETTADIDVAESFRGALWLPDDAGGLAWQLPRTNPAHIFRRNPSDRASEVNSTVKDDYFLEDPYETVRSDSNQDGSQAFRITLAPPAAGTPGGNEVVYYIDGNLWLHNRHTYSFKLYSADGSPVRVTFVVKGNIYFSDNLFYEDEADDGVLFIALKDEDQPRSGNIYFGDPEFGTMLEMQGFMYAEENFYDVNLDESGSARVTVRGNMTAGNQVLINRDYGTKHTKLTVDFDDRLRTGEIELPGAPDLSTHATDISRFRVVTWRKVAHERF